MQAQVYESARGNLHESSYNIGRAAHGLGLSHLAHHYYQRALAAAPGKGGPAGAGAGGDGAAAAGKDRETMEGVEGPGSGSRAGAGAGAGAGSGGGDDGGASGVQGFWRQLGGGLQQQQPELGVGGLSDVPPPASLDLTREIAHNLALLYRASGAVHLARRVYRQYLTVV